MSTSKSPAHICLPAHILDANISPRAREVLMLLASQTNERNPTLWVCHAAIAENLRCSPVTVKRAIQKLVEANLIVETGDLHERRFKFYRIRWSLNAVMQARAVEPDPASLRPRASAAGSNPDPKVDCVTTFAMTVSSPQSVCQQKVVVNHEPCSGTKIKEKPKPESLINEQPRVSNSQSLMPKDSLFAQYYERAQQRHQEYLRKYQIDPSSFR